MDWQERIAPGSYQTLLNKAQASYTDVMQGYQNTLQGQQGAQAGISAGYGALQGQVANTLGYGGTPWGVAAPAAQAIGDVYAAQQGRASQGLINSGLGNTTVMQSVQRGIGLDAAKAYGGLGAQLAQTYAGYQSQLGLAGLNYQNQANQQNQALQQQQLQYQGAYHPQGFGGGGQGFGGGGFNAGGVMGPVRAPGLGSGQHPSYGGGQGGGYGGGQSGPNQRNAPWDLPYMPPPQGGYGGGDAGGGDWGGYGGDWGGGDAGGGDWGVGYQESASNPYLPLDEAFPDYAPQGDSGGGDW